MATHKYLDLTGAQALWKNAKAKFGATLDYGEYTPEGGATISNCIMLKNASGDVLDYFDAGVFLKDSMLSNVSYDASTKEFTFTWNTTEAGEEGGVTKVSLDGLVDTYTAGDKLSLASGKFSHVKDGPTGGYTSTASDLTLDTPGDNGSFTIPSLTVNEYGHVTAVGTKTIAITLPTPEAMPDIPTVLPNPNALTIKTVQGSSENTVTYTGSEAKTVTVNIPEELKNPYKLNLSVNGEVVTYDGSAEQTVTFACTDEKTTLEGHYTPANGTAVAVAGSVELDALAVVTGISYDSKGHVTSVQLKNVNIEFASEADIDAICI